MILTIWRHGQAANAAVDSERELTETGMDDVGFGSDQFRQQCELRKLPLPGLIFHSRWLRTSQTADIISRHFPQAALEAAEVLIPGSGINAVNHFLENYTEAAIEHLMLVSHQPLVSALVDHYLGESGRVAPLVPGGFAVLDMDVVALGCADLLFSAQPPEYRPQA